MAAALGGCGDGGRVGGSDLWTLPLAFHMLRPDAPTVLSDRPGMPSPTTTVHYGRLALGRAVCAPLAPLTPHRQAPSLAYRFRRVRALTLRTCRTGAPRRCHHCKPSRPSDR